MGKSLKKSKRDLEIRIRGYEQLVKNSKGGGGKEYTKPGSMKK